MAGLIAEETIERIKERVDIVELISSYLPLKRSGGNYQGLCPFHGEKSPSFNVNPARQIFHCFGCGVGGNVVSFLMKMEGLSFPEAVRRLGEKVGIEVAEDAPSAELAQRRAETARLLRVSEVAATAYEKCLLKTPAGAAGRDYLKGRGYDSEMAKRFLLGLAPDRSDFLAGELAQAGVESRDAETIGLLRPGKDGRSRFDLFRNRLIFPIHDERGRIVAFGGRALGDAQPKYLNSPESPLYHKGRILYGLFQAKEEIRRTNEVIVVEGYFDLLALHRAGFTRSVATCGTALTSDQARLLKRLASRVFLLFDQDNAGQKANLRAMEVFLGEGLSPLLVTLDAGDDPDSWLRQHGPEALQERLAAARPALEIFIEKTLTDFGDTIEGRARAAEAILPMLRLLPSEIERNLYLKSLSRKTGIDETLLLRGGGVAARPQPGRTHAPVPVQTTVARPQGREIGGERIEKAQDLILHLLLNGSIAAALLERDGVETLFPDPRRQKIARAALDFAARGEHIDPNVLTDRLDAEAQSLLSGVLIRDERGVDRDAAESTYDDCRRTVLKDVLQRRSRELTDAVRRAELGGDPARAAALQAEQIEINRRLKTGKFSDR